MPRARNTVFLFISFALL